MQHEKLKKDTIRVESQLTGFWHYLVASSVNYQALPVLRDKFNDLMSELKLQHKNLIEQAKNAEPKPAPSPIELLEKIAKKQVLTTDILKEIDRTLSQRKNKQKPMNI